MKRNAVSENVLRDITYDNYIVQYEGDIESEVSKRPGHHVIVLNERHAILSQKKEFSIDINELNFPSIVYINTAVMFTLQQISSVSPVDASQIKFLQLNLPLNLTGTGVNVAIIDSGIDYLNSELMKPNGETRIEAIWDQTIISNRQDEANQVPYGTVYTREEINNAIQAYRNGNSPYTIVPSKDEIGHGTNMAGIIGGRGQNPILKGMAPDCDFIVVKLIEDFSYEAQFPETEVPVFNITTIFAAFQYLREYSLKTRKPMVIYFPLGASLGNHQGNGLLEEFIENISSTSGVAVVTPTGNQRDAGGHASGTIIPISGVQQSAAGVMELEVAPEQKNLWTEIWVDKPNVMSLDIVSPSGESTGVIPILINSTKDYTFIFEKTSIRVNYYFPEVNTGDELIRVRFYNIQEGIWRLRVVGNLILDGRYNAWLPQRGLTVGTTRFSFPDPFGTITNPGNSKYIITAAAYNQNNNNLTEYSGVAQLDDFIDRVDIAAGGVNALTIAPNNATASVNGTSVAGAVVAGVCAILFQWGIVEGNDPNIYSQTVKAYLAKGGVARSGDIIPNPFWGYGMLNVLKMFQNMV